MKGSPTVTNSASRSMKGQNTVCVCGGVIVYMHVHVWKSEFHDCIFLNYFPPLIFGAGPLLNPEHTNEHGIPSLLPAA